LSFSFSRLSSIFSRMFKGFLFESSFLIKQYPRVVFHVYSLNSLNCFVFIKSCDTLLFILDKQRTTQKMQKITLKPKIVKTGKLVGNRSLSPCFLYNGQYLF
jgi:hypothetical protein